MVRGTRSGRTPATVDDSGLSYREKRKKVSLNQKRKRYEKEQAKHCKSAANGGYDLISTRARSSLAQEFSSCDDGKTLFGMPSPSPVKKRRTRLGTISCTDYGLLRHAFYNKPVAQYVFCGQCDRWDQDKDIVPNIQQGSRRYKCVASHTSRIFPTTRIQSLYQRKRGSDCTETNPTRQQKEPTTTSARRGLTFGDAFDGSDSHAQSTYCLPDSTTDSPALPATYTVEELVTIIVNQKKAILGLKKTVIVRTRTIRNLNQRLDANDATIVEPDGGPENEEAVDDGPCSPAVKSGRKNPKSQNANFHEKVTSMLDQLVATIGWGRRRVGRELALLIFDYDESVCLESLINKSKAWLRTNVFTCYNILREMDRAGGTLGYEGIEIMRSVETKKVKWYKGSVIPSIAEFKRTAKKVEQLAHVLAPFTLGTTTAGDKECIDFQPYWKIMGTIFRAFGLLGVGRLKSLLCMFSLDGAKITKNLGHTMAGLKMVDRSMRCPITGELLLSDSTTSNAQSRSYVFPLFLMMGPETKESIKEVEPMFKFMEACESEDPVLNPMSKHYGLLPMTCGANSDLSAGWKCLCRGGAAKVSNHPCHCCALHKDKWAQANSNDKKQDCAWCHETLNTGIPPPAAGDAWKCYHHRMMTEDSLATGQVELDLLTGGLQGNLALIDAGSKMQLDDVETPTPTSRANPSSIHYMPDTGAARIQFGILLSDELVLRDMSPLGTLTVKRDSLAIALAAEAKIRLLLTELAHGSRSEGAMFLLIQAIPCILHLENRVGIKILTMLFIEGLSNAKKGVLYNDVPAEGPRIKRFFERVATIVNKEVLGTADSSTEWQCATDEKKKEIGTIQMDNVRTRRIMGQLELLVEECIVKEDDKAKWLACIPKFRNGMIKLRSREDFDDAAIFSFQKDMDEFFQLWVALWGLEGCTNYIHMMSSGHLSVYLQKWKNLYRHSQQGWEAFNSLLKTFYFRRTQRGGSSNGGLGRKSRLLPVGRWLQRRVIWLCGYEGAYIDSWIADNPGACRSGDLLNGGGEANDEPAADDELDAFFTGLEGFV